MKKIIIFLLLMGGFFICQNYVAAANSGDVVINELMWMGSKEFTYSDEWLELRNLTNQEIDFSVHNWKIEKNDSLMVTINQKKIEAFGYFLISRRTKENSILNIDPDLITTFNLNDEERNYKLRDDLNNLIDEIKAPLVNTDSTKKISMERNLEPNNGTLDSDWHTSLSSVNLDLTAQASATPKAENSQAPLQPVYSDQIIINEIYPDPADSEDNEFIELYNNSDQDVDLANWQIGDNTTSRYTIKTSDFSSITIKAKNYFLISRQISSIALNNDGDKVFLYQPNQNILDQISYDQSQEGQSYNKVNAAWQWSTTRTPNAANIITVLSSEEKKVSDKKESSKDSAIIIPKGPYSKNIIITEILPNPKGSDLAPKGEFIEIKNTSQKTIDLYAWYLDDAKSGSKPYQIKDHLKIKANSYYVFYKSQIKLSINNSKESVRIIWPDQKVWQEIKFKESAKENFSYALKDNKWSWTSTPTPGKDNIITAEASKIKTSSSKTKIDVNSETTNIKDLKNKKRYDKVKTSGIITVPPKIFSDNYFYIQDSTSGIKIYSSKKDFPDLKVGDQIEVSGKLSESAGEKRILISKASDINVIGTNQSSPLKQAKTSQINEELEGQFVQISGKLEKSIGNVSYINDGSGTAKIYFSPNAKIIKPKIKKGDWATYQGIVSQSTGGYRLMPAFSSDVKLGKFSINPAVGLTQIPKAGTNSVIYLFAIIIFSSSYFIVKKNFI